MPNLLSLELLERLLNFVATAFDHTKAVLNLADEGDLAEIVVGTKLMRNATASLMLDCLSAIQSMSDAANNS